MWKQKCSKATHPHAGSGAVTVPPCCLPLGRQTFTKQPPELARPSPRHHICSTTEDASTRTSICSYAKIATLAQQDLSSLDDMWDPQDACSQAILPGKC